VSRLIFAGNHAQSRGLEAFTDYAWDSPQAIVEMDFTDNTIAIAADLQGKDPFSALLRCLYNHPGYPRRVARAATQNTFPQPSGLIHDNFDAKSQFDVEPITLRFGGNYIPDPSELLRHVCEKGGQDKVSIRQDALPYNPAQDVFVSTFLPDIMQQRSPMKPANSEGACSSNTRAHEPVESQTAVASDQSSKQGASGQKELLSTNCVFEQKANNTNGVLMNGSNSLVKSPCPQVASSSSSTTHATNPLSSPAQAESVPTYNGMCKPLLDDREIIDLQLAVRTRFVELGMPSQKANGIEHLAGFVTNLVESGKEPTRVKTELALCLGTDHGKTMADWLLEHVWNLRFY